MANILFSTPGWAKRLGNMSFRVEWRDDGGLIRERFFNSFQEAERFALEIERLLLNDAVQDICMALPPHRHRKSKKKWS